MSKIRILTFHYVINNGAILQAYSICTSLQKRLPESDIKILNYRSMKLELLDLAKIFKLYSNCPFFNLQRYFRTKQFIKRNLLLDNDVNSIEDMGKLERLFNSKKYDMLVVGSDSIWKIPEQRFHPAFPNIYWLSEKINSRKVSYSACACPTEPEVVARYGEGIKARLNSFDMIGVRDDFTFDLAQKSVTNKSIPVITVPDPTFMYDLDAHRTNVKEILIKNGLDINRPIFGILHHGADEFSLKVLAHFKKKGYQTVALSMYNKWVDVNLGHVLNPFEWAEVFKYMTFCVTDRFHGAIFCLKNNTPFVLMESQNVTEANGSRKTSLLMDFDMMDLYDSIYSDGFDIQVFLDKCDRILVNWEKRTEHIGRKLSEMKERNEEFIENIKTILDSNP